jgi:hypothetical protein
MMTNLSTFVCFEKSLQCNNVKDMPSPNEVCDLLLNVVMLLSRCLLVQAFFNLETLKKNQVDQSLIGPNRCINQINCVCPLFDFEDISNYFDSCLCGSVSY